MIVNTVPILHDATQATVETMELGEVAFQTADPSRRLLLRLWRGAFEGGAQNACRGLAQQDAARRVFRNQPPQGVRAQLNQLKVQARRKTTTTMDLPRPPSRALSRVSSTGSGNRSDYIEISAQSNVASDPHISPPPAPEE